MEINNTRTEVTVKYLLMQVDATLEIHRDGITIITVILLFYGIGPQDIKQCWVVFRLNKAINLLNIFKGFPQW